ncbi:hypothetical protein AB1Y20_018972 [Prymnesium parvum]|uniref:J domain-containing protein n=1 Tax=Prymnesium parvum TaxID=97485 RepID=A0AB34JQ70_PRYPA
MFVDVSKQRPHLQPRENEKNPLQDLFGGVARGVGHTVEDVFCAITRKPLPGNSTILADARVLLRLGGAAAQTKHAHETILMLGGTVVEHPDLATHCLVRAGLSAADLAEHRALLEICKALNVAVVEPSWLEAAANMARTQRDANWNAVVIDSYVSPIMAELSQQLAAEGAGAPSSRGAGAARVAERPAAPAWRPAGPTHSDATHSHAAAPFMSSLKETRSFICREQPEVVEERELRRAIELSMLDCAITLRKAAEEPGDADEPPEEVLGVAKDAPADVIRAAYRARALAAHPDKGGSPTEFQRIERAYRRLRDGTDVGVDHRTLPMRETPLSLEGPKRDEQLREHRALVQSWFVRHGEDLSARAAAQRQALLQVGLQVKDVGATNRNELGHTMYNQCFYLSLACSYMSGETQREVLEETALHLKRVIEAAVLRAHPEWAGKSVGEDVQAFSDFLFFVIGSDSLLSEIAISVFDSVSGGVEIYKGVRYDFGANANDEQQRANLISIYYVPGHYQALVPAPNKLGPTLSEMLATLDSNGVCYVVTDG